MRSRLATLLLCLLANLPVKAGPLGEPGKPINLKVGYQPYSISCIPGTVQKAKDFWKKYLPAGSTVEFVPFKKGMDVTVEMLKGSIHIGYVGDVPAIRAATSEKVADIRLVASAVEAVDQCNNLLVSSKAPSFAKPQEALKWINGKTIAVPFGSCGEIFLRNIVAKNKIEPKIILNKSLDEIVTAFGDGSIDAAVAWESTTSRILGTGKARMGASGADFGEKDISVMIALNDLIKDRPDIMKAWLNAELDTQQFIADPANAKEVVEIVHKGTPEIPTSLIWAAAYKKREDRTTKFEFPFVLSPGVRAMFQSGTKFLASRKLTSTETLREEAFADSITAEVAKSRGVKLPIVVKSRTDDLFK